MDNYKLVETFSEFKEFKNIDREAMMRIIEDVFRGMLNKKFETETDDFIDIIVNVDKGDFEIYHNRTVVEDDEMTDPLRQIKLSDAIKIEPDFEVGEEVNEELRIENFGRRDILALRQLPITLRSPWSSAVLAPPSILPSPLRSLNLMSPGP